MVYGNCRVLVECFLNGAELLVNSGNLIIHWSRNWAQFKDSVSHMCLAGAVVASWSLTQEVGLGGRFKPFYCNDKYFFANEFSKFIENI